MQGIYSILKKVDQRSLRLHVCVIRETSALNYITLLIRDVCLEARQLPDIIIRRRMLGVRAFHRIAFAPYHVRLGWANH